MKRFLSILLAVVMVLSMVTPVFAGSFEDTKGTKHETAIEFLTGLGIVNGKTATEYDPDGIVTRAEMAKLLVYCLKLESGADILKDTVSFDDVEGHWAIGYINVAAQYGLIKGDGDGNFRPNDTVNYAEAVTMIIRTLGKGKAVESEGQWPTNYIAEAGDLELLDNVDEFKSGEGATRGAVAEMVWNMLNTHMWYLESENRQNGEFVYSESSKDMLEIKFPKYSFETLTFSSWEYDVEDDKFVVTLNFSDTIVVDEETIDLVPNGLTYEGNDFYTFVKGTKLDVLSYSDSEDDKVISLVINEKNYLDEGKAKELSDKYDDYEAKVDGTNIYSYIRLAGSKKSADVYNEFTVHAASNEIVEKVEYKESAKYTKVETDGIDYTIEDAEGLADTDNAMIIKDGKRVDITKLAVNDVITWFAAANGDEVGIVSNETVKGEFNSIKEELNKLEEVESVTIKISGKEYVLGVYPTDYVELDKDGDEREVEVAKLKVKESENDYFGEEVTAYLDAFGNIHKVAFGNIEGVVKNIALYLVVDGAFRTVETADDATEYITLANKENSKGYKIAEDNKLDKSIVEGGKMYWVELNSNDEVVKMTLVADGATHKDYTVASLPGKFNKDTSYFGGVAASDGQEAIEGKKVSDSTVIYTISEVKKDDNNSYNPPKYELKVSNGSAELDGVEGGLVACEDNSIKASFIVVNGEAKSTDKLIGILDKISLESEVLYVTISGTEYEYNLDADVEAVDVYAALNAMKGNVVAYTLDDDEATIHYGYSVTELTRAGLVTKVTAENTIIVKKGENETEYDIELFDIETEDGGYGYEDYTVIVIEVLYKDGVPYFETAEIKSFDEVKFEKDDCIALNSSKDKGYFAVIKGYDMVETTADAE